MAIDPQTALNRLVHALEGFHSAVESAQDPDAPSVLRASDRLADAYTVYDDAIFTQFGVEAPFDTYSDDDYDDDLDDDDLDDIDDLDEEDLDDFDDDDDLDELDDEDNDDDDDLDDEDDLEDDDLN